MPMCFKSARSTTAYQISNELKLGGGSNFEDWVKRCEEYFTKYGFTTDNEKIEVGLQYITDWLKNSWLAQRDEGDPMYCTWEDFKQHMMEEIASASRMSLGLSQHSRKGG
jgi:hypothetical protein